jgi:hypothetical protein
MMLLWSVLSHSSLIHRVLFSFSQTPCQNIIVILDYFCQCAFDGFFSPFTMDIVVEFDGID